MKLISSMGALLALLAIAATPATQEWRVDPIHTTAQFTAKHFGIVPVVGTIPVISATVTMRSGSEIPEAVKAELDPSKVDTHNDRRDNDLRSVHFFDVATTPQMSFISTKISGSDPKNFTITGNLTMHGQTHPVTLTAQVAGHGTDPRGREIIAYTASGSIARSDWGMTYGPIIVANGVDIALTVEADKPR